MLPAPFFSYRKLVYLMKRHPVQTIALLILLAVIGLFLPAHAQDTLGLTATQLRTIDRLGTEALKHSSLHLNASRELEAAKQAESALGITASSLNLSIGAGIGANDPFEQVNTRASLSLSLNVSDLSKKLAAPSQVPALEAKALEIERNLKLEVLRKYSDWRLNVAKATNAANSLDVRLAERKAVEARIKAGTATQVDLLRTLDAIDNAQVSLLESNHAVVIAKSELCRVVGVNMDRLNDLLKSPS
jgi:outer membrane protein TolC